MPRRVVRRRRRPVPKATEFAAAVGRRIRELREARGMSQTELGAPYLTRAGISAIERSVTAPSIHVLVHLSRKLGVRVVALLEAAAKRE